MEELLLTALFGHSTHKRAGTKYLSDVSIELPPDLSSPAARKRRREASEAMVTKLERAYAHEGLLLRTIECLRSRSSSTAEYSSGLERLEACTRREWDSADKLVPGSFVRHDLPKSVFPNTLVRWTWRETSFAGAFGVGLVMPPPELAARGSAWPHDAFLSSQAVAETRRRCTAHDMLPSSYARRRWRALRHELKDERCELRLQHFAHSSEWTCWSFEWEKIFRMQRAFWTRVQQNTSSRSFSLTSGCAFGTPWNQVHFSRAHVRRSLALFYSNFSNARTPPGSKVGMHAVRSLAVAIRLQASIRPFVALPIVQLLADGKISKRSPAFRSLPFALPLPGASPIRHTTHLSSGLDS